MKPDLQSVYKRGLNNHIGGAGVGSFLVLKKESQAYEPPHSLVTGDRQPKGERMTTPYNPCQEVTFSERDSDEPRGLASMLESKREE